MLALGLDGKLPNFRVDFGRLEDAVDLVLSVMQKNCPTLDVPFHSRWRHFVTHRLDRREEVTTNLTEKTARARADFDLAFVSVLLDAGAGPRWSYQDTASESSFARSEGLAVASISMFGGGTFRLSPSPIRCAPMRMY